MELPLSLNLLMDTLPLDLTEKIYREARRDLIKSIPRAYFEHYVKAHAYRIESTFIGPFHKWRPFKRAYDKIYTKIIKEPMPVVFVYLDQLERLFLENQHFVYNRHEMPRYSALFRNAFRMILKGVPSRRGSSRHAEFGALLHLCVTTMDHYREL